MTESIDSIQNSALDGNPQAQYELGQMYEFGRGVGQDYTEAMDWYIKAANKDHAQAQYAIGLLYEHGRGVVPNASTVAEWYTKAANQGDTWAINNLSDALLLRKRCWKQMNKRPMTSIYKRQILDTFKRNTTWLLAMHLGVVLM